MNVKTILNAAALVLGLVGIYFKHQYWAGADILLLAGFVLLLISTVAFTIGDNTAAGVPASLNYTMVATVAVGILSTVFKVLHWEGADMLVLVTLLLMVILALLFVFSKAAVASSRQFLAVAFVYFTLSFAVVYFLARMRPPGATTAPVAAAEAAR
jgi:membrane-bound ClpP family serine protease